MANEQNLKKFGKDKPPLELHATIFHSLVLRVFRGSQYLGGYWENVAKTENDKFFGTIKSRKYKCNRRTAHSSRFATSFARSDMRFWRA